jgi:CRP-like cAMP-binding protein
MSTSGLTADREAIVALGECFLFKDLSPDKLPGILSRASVRTYQPGDLICARGTIGSEFFIVVQGEVEITVHTEGASSFNEPDMPDETQVSAVGRGDCFGEIACLEEKGVRTANVRTRHGCRLIVIPRMEFLRLIETHPSVAMGLARHLAEQVRHYTNSLAGLVSPQVYEQEELRQRTVWQWLADTAAAWTAHWSFLTANVALWVIWLTANGPQLVHDLPTINGLTMWASLQAIIMTTFVLVAQRRADEKERRRKELQFQWASATMERMNQVSQRLDALEARGNSK